MPPRRFPDGFLWGTATSSHQVEGQNTNNQWWAWEHTPGHIWHGDRSGDACDWWHNAEADFDRAAALGQNAHRLSIEWSRIEPQEGRWDEAALDRYRAMLVALHARGLRPMVTLHHFTHPLWLEAQGGWLNPDTPRKFARFAAHAVRRLGDVCDLWCTLNEPIIFAAQGYLVGEFPPGVLSIRQTLAVTAALLRGHAAAVAAIRAVNPALWVGLVHHVRPFDPIKHTPLNAAVAWLYDYLFNDLVLLALRTGRLLPPIGHGQTVPELRDSCDFIGLNYYTRSRVKFDPRAARTLFGHRWTPNDVVQSDIGRSGMTYGEIYPDGLYVSLCRLRPFNVPIYITEFGLPDNDDDQRPQFILDHLGAVHRALSEGIDIRGVFLWSLVDNFEWAEGWGLRFGLYALDTKTQQRTLRPSAGLYAAIARANAIPAETPAQETAAAEATAAYITIPEDGDLRVPTKSGL